MSRMDAMSALKAVNNIPEADDLRRGHSRLFLKGTLKDQEIED